MGLLPVTLFLAVLVLLDSYKLVKLRFVVAMLACGIAVAGIAFVLHSTVLGGVPMTAQAFTRYVSPVTEELLKGGVLAVLIRRHRIGFLVDAAIIGFAVGTGFAIVENIHYLQRTPDAGMGAWIVRGFGTSLMHGGTTAIFAVTGMALGERRERVGIGAFVPGFAMAVALHSIFNHFFASPVVSTLIIVLLLPLLLVGVFERSERAVGEWLGKGFDADTQMLALIESGRLSDSPVGRYLQELRARFAGTVVADLLCYVRLHTELALRAKGILMMRESGFDAPLDDETRGKFAEMRYLERSIGKTGLLALQPMLPQGRKEFWQLYMLGK